MPSGLLKSPSELPQILDLSASYTQPTRFAHPRRQINLSLLQVPPSIPLSLPADATTSCDCVDNNPGNTGAEQIDKPQSPPIRHPFATFFAHSVVMSVNEWNHK